MLTPEKERYLEADETGRIILPSEISSRYNLKPGRKIRLDEGPNGLQIYLPWRLSKLYIEPTNMCNLDCRTCMRNTWDEKQGMMSEEVFSRIIEGLKEFNPMPSVFFGGIGEPLAHPDIVRMISRFKDLEIPVELITNGVLLTKEKSLELLDARLDTLWVSIDGATPESYADIRLGATLPQVLENLADFRKLVREREIIGNSIIYFSKPVTKLGISFVAMKRNIADLPAVINLGQRYNAEHFMVTNLLPYSKDMINETLYYRAIISSSSRIQLPDIDATEKTYKPYYEAISNVNNNWAGLNTEIIRDRCPFITKGAGAISWNGSLSPCVPLMHNFTSYLGYLRYEERFSRHWEIGNIKDKSLSELWNTPEHIAFRERVQSFDFAPCTTCGSCDLIEKNEEDCYGNTFPTCGGCLWAQGVIQCP
jgi:MoaA/NifB/PqqE/SkfB family radical SAM enzyme